MTCTRTKLENLGAAALSDEELLTLLGGPPARSLPFSQLSQMSVADLCEYPGMGPMRAATLAAGLELGKRLHQPGGVHLGTPEQVYAHVADMATLRKEHVRGLYLDTRRRLLRQETISIGTLTGSLVHPREVLQPAVEALAHSFILVHNHPSGDPTPSPDDLAMTRRLRQAGELLGIELLDHLIIGRTGFISLRERGEI